MIDVISGAIGAGKTYHAVANFFTKAIKARRRIITNIEGLDERELSYVTGVPLGEIDIWKTETKDTFERRFFLPEHDTEYSTVHFLKGTVCIIDEAQLIWYNREWKMTSKEFVFFLTKHRHIDCDIVFITQDIKQIDAAIRRLGNYFWHISNRKIFGFKFFANVYKVSLSLSGEPDAPVYTTSNYRYEDKYFRCFTSAIALDNQMKRKFGIPSQFYFLAFVLLFIIYAMSDWRKFYNSAIGGRSSPRTVPVADSPYNLGIPRGGVSSVVPAPVPSVPSLPPSKDDCVVERRGGCYQFGNEPRKCEYKPVRVCNGVPQYPKPFQNRPAPVLTKPRDSAITFP